MMPTIYILITLLLPLGLGYFLTLYLTRRNPLPRPFSLAVGYGLGTGILTQWMLFLGVFKIPLTSLTINVPLLVFALILKRQLHNKGVKILSINVCQLKIFQDFNFLNLLMIFYISLNPNSETFKIIEFDLSLTLKPTSFNLSTTFFIEV